MHSSEFGKKSMHMNLSMLPNDIMENSEAYNFKYIFTRQPKLPKCLKIHTLVTFTPILTRKEILRNISYYKLKYNEKGLFSVTSISINLFMYHRNSFYDISIIYWAKDKLEILNLLSWFFDHIIVNLKFADLVLPTRITREDSLAWFRWFLCYLFTMLNNRKLPLDLDFKFPDPGENMNLDKS